MLTANASSGRSFRAARLVAALWLLTAAVGALPGLFLARFADDAAARIGATVLLSCSGLASGLAAFVGSRGTSALKVSLAGSAVIAGGAITALTILSASGNLGTKGGLLFGAVPVTGAILTAVAGALQLRSARPASAGT